MAWLNSNGVTRRGFVLSALPFGGMLARTEAPSPRWALLSDTHVPGNPANEYRGFRPFENTMKAISQVSEIKPDGVVICGDLARLEGEIADYENLKRLLEPLPESIPVGLALGNHDNRKNFLRVFSKQPAAQQVKDKHVVVLETPVVRLILLDSLFIVNLVSGLLGKGQRMWLESYLQTASTVPTVLFVHHTLDDGDGSLLDGPRLFEMVRDRRMVKAIVYGHSHVYSFRKEGDIDLINLPAIGYNFSDAQPVGWVEGVFHPEGAAFTLHAMAGNRANDRQTTRVRWRV